MHDFLGALELLVSTCHFSSHQSCGGSNDFSCVLEAVYITLSTHQLFTWVGSIRS